MLWLDAHSDYNTPPTSPSGNMHGMPVAMLSGEPGFEAIFGDEPRGLVDPSHVHLFGIRSIDADERRLLKARGVDVVDMRRLDEDGFALSIRRIIDRVRAADGMLHVSLDVDFLDPTIAPGVGTAVPGGASYREAHLVMELLYEFRALVRRSTWWSSIRSLTSAPRARCCWSTSPRACSGGRFIKADGAVHAQLIEFVEVWWTVWLTECGKIAAKGLAVASWNQDPGPIALISLVRLMKPATRRPQTAGLRA